MAKMAARSTRQRRGYLIGRAHPADLGLRKAKNFDDVLHLESGLPAGATATFNPLSVTPGGSATNVTLTIAAPSSQAMNAPARRGSTRGTSASGEQLQASSRPAPFSLTALGESPVLKGHDFTGCGKTRGFERARLQPCLGLGLRPVKVHENVSPSTTTRPCGGSRGLQAHERRLEDWSGFSRGPFCLTLNRIFDPAVTNG